MKKILNCTLLICLLTSCSLMRSPAKLVSNALDYSVYEKQGFFLTEATSVSFGYKPVSSVSSINIGGYKVIGKKDKTFSDDIYGSQRTQSYTKTSNEYIAPTQTLVLDELVKKALSNGANGIINLNIRYHKNYFDKGGFEEWYVATGMAIKR